MALSLGVKKNSVIHIGESLLEVVDITPTTLRVDVDGRTYEISTEYSTEVLPQVRVFRGPNHSKAHGNEGRLAIVAHTSIRIERDGRKHTQVSAN